MSRITVLRVGGLAIAIVFIAFGLVDNISNAHGINIFLAPWSHYIHDVFYTLNEEMMLGAVLLFSTTRIFPKQSGVVAIALALLFAVIHLIFFGWLVIEPGWLSFPALATLFWVGIIRNVLILKFRHVGYAWALHLSWVVMMLGCHHVYAATGEFLAEVERFNLYLGSGIVCFIAMQLAALSLIANRRILRLFIA